MGLWRVWINKIAKPLYIGVAVILLYFALKGLDWGSFATSVIHMQPIWLIFALALELVALLARAVRWNILLAHQSGNHVFVAFVGEIVGDLGNTFLPARAGEVARTLSVARKLDMELGFVAGTVATERISDAVFLAMSAFCMLPFIPQVPIWLTSSAVIFFVLGVSLLLIMVFLPTFNRLVLPLLHKLSLPKSMIVWLDKTLAGIKLGTHGLLGHPRQTLLYIMLTMIVWGADSASIVCLAHALGVQLTVTEAVVFLCGLGLSSAIPSTPGYIGIYQFVAVSILGPFGISHAHALAIVLVFQITVLLQELLWGGLGWLMLHKAEVPNQAKKSS